MNSIDDTMNPVTVEPPNFATEVVAAVVAENYNLSGDYTPRVFRTLSGDKRSVLLNWICR
jgi:hypothetical protein